MQSDAAAAKDALLFGCRMHTVELLEEACSVAQSLGYTVRQEWLDGGGGSCELKGKRWLFVDLSLPTVEQLDQVVEVLRNHVSDGMPLSPQLRKLLAPRKAA